MERETRMKRCPKCEKVKALTEFYVSSRTGKCQGYCKPCSNRASREYQKNPANLDAVLRKAEKWRVKTHAVKPERLLLFSAKARAKRKNLPFNIEEGDFHIPQTCPVLGIPLLSGRGTGGYLPSSPTVDQINPGGGYVKGNVRVISHRANALKSNATLVEIIKVALDGAQMLERSGVAQNTHVPRSRTPVSNSEAKA